MRIVWLSILFAGLCFSVASAEGLSGTLHDIKSSGKVRMGYRTSLPPLSFQDSKGEPAGYSVDLCSRIADSLEKKLSAPIKREYVAVTVQDRFRALTEKRIDILCGATTDTLTRREDVDFTLHIFASGGSYLMLREKTLQDGFTGKKIGVVRGTTTEEALRRILREEDVKAEVVLLDETAEGILGLLDETIDVFSADQVVLVGLAAAAQYMGKFKLLPDMISFEPIALAVRKNDADFRLVADRTLANLYRTGTISEVYEKWFGGIAGEKPAALRAMIQLNALPE